MLKFKINSVAGHAAYCLSTAGATAITLGVNPGNDPFDDGAITIGNVTSAALAKCDLDVNFVCDWTDGASSGDYTSAFTIVLDADNKSGTWTFDPMLVTGLNGTPVLFPLFVATKGGEDFVLSQVINSFSGTFSTAGITVGMGNQPEVSHTSSYNGATSIPLPAAAWLLLSGIGGLGVMGWRKRRITA